MKADQIREGQVLKLRADNPYGIDAEEEFIRVARLNFKDGYRTPWVIDAEGRAFRPSDFQRVHV